MIIPKEKIAEAKKKLGDEAARIIARDLNIQEFDDKNLKGLCVFHEESTPSFIWDGKPDDYYFKCFGCGRVYSIIDHFMSFNHLTYIEAVQKLFELTDTNYRFGERGLKEKRDYRYPEYKLASNRNEVNNYFARRKISKETLDYCDVQQDINGLIIWNFYNENDVLVTVKCRHTRKPVKGENKEWYLPNYDNTPILYNMNKVDPSKPLVLTEGQIDCLSVIESGYKNVVSIPGGTENMKWVEECFDWLNTFDSLIVWFDNDKPGIDARREACARLGVYKTKFVDLPLQLKKDDGTYVKTKDANEVLFQFGKEKILDFINNAQEVPVVGISDLAEIEEFDIESTPGIYSGLSAIDNVIYKFILGSVVVVTGQRGAGKSTLINQSFVCEPINQGHDVFIFSGELSPKVLKSWIELSMCGPENVKMKGDFIHIIDPKAKQEMRDWYSKRIWVYDQDNNSVDAILEKAITVIRKYGVKVIILDNLSVIDLGNNDNNLNEKQKDIMVRLINLAKMYGILIVLIIHPRKLQVGQELVGDDVSGAGALTNLPQYVLSVRRYTKKEKLGEKDNKGGYKKGKEPFSEDVEITVIKNRYTGKIESTKLFFNYKSYRFFSDAKELFKRFGWNKNISPIPTLASEDDRFKDPSFMSNNK
jgi:twinkle protein